VTVRETPASSAQRRLWFLARIEPESLEYVIPFAFRMRGPLDVEALDRSLLEIVRRHEALRTRFAVRDGLPVQVVEEAPARLLRTMVAGGATAADREREAGELLARDLLRPFDLSCAPLLRVLLVRLDGEDHVIGFAVHHAVFDGWSVGIMGAELRALYGAFAVGAEADLDPPALQYADMAVRPVPEGELEHWRRRLAGAPAVLDLPTDRPRPARRSGRGAEHAFRLEPALAAAVLELTRRHRVTPYVTLLAAFAALLRRYTGQTDLCVGSPVASRDRVQLEGTIGFLVNMLVLRLDLSGDPTFADLLGRARATVLEALGHQGVPFDRVVEAVNPPRDRSTTPLFQVMANLQRFARPVVAMHGLALEDWPMPSVSAQVDLALEVIQSRDGIDCRLVYATDLYEPATVALMGAHYVALLGEALGDPGRRLSALRLLDARERALVVGEWNRTRAAYPDACLHELVSAVARRCPDAVAAEDAGGRLTYSELEAWSNRVAHELAARGVATGAAVGVCVGRSVAMVAALLGVLKAGAAYVPVDPAFPAERMDLMLRDSGAAVVLRDGDLGVEGRSDEPPAVRARPGQLAYVMYTSGSRGRPKGVEITHRSLVNLLVAMRDELDARAEDVMLATTTVSFDIAGLELFLPLLVGARIAIAPGDCAGNPAALARAVARFRPTIMQATPTTWRLLVESGWPGAPGVRGIAIGEVLPPWLAGRLVELGVSLWNLYGPTETTIYSTGERVMPDRALAIGRPLANNTVYVLDPALEPVPIGVAGDLHIGGDGVAAGYRGRAGLTAERFVPDPFSDRPGARLYATGDRARFRPDGRLDFLGRADDQVKIHGVRIELGEVEHHLSAHEAIEGAVVDARVTARGERRLVAYLRPRSAARPAPAELRRWLRRHLPDAMVPPEFVFVDDFPRTPNGKLDRRALPAPPLPGVAGDRELEPPRTEAERELAAIWREVLRVDEVSVRDDFFDLGGHSMAALQVVEAIAERLGVDLPADVVFDAPTLAELAAAVAGG
jgi:amino acid adenylation domain-containing protein